MDVPPCHSNRIAAIALAFRTVASRFETCAQLASGAEQLIDDICSYAVQACRLAYTAKDLGAFDGDPWWETWDPLVPRREDDPRYRSEASRDEEGVLELAWEIMLEHWLLKHWPHLLRCNAGKLNRKTPVSPTQTTREFIEDSYTPKQRLAWQRNRALAHGEACIAMAMYLEGIQPQYPTDLIPQFKAADIAGVDSKTIKRWAMNKGLPTYGPSHKVSESEFRRLEGSLRERRARTRGNKSNPKKGT